MKVDFTVRERRIFKAAAFGDNMSFLLHDCEILTEKNITNKLVDTFYEAVLLSHCFVSVTLN